MTTSSHSILKAAAIWLLAALVAAAQPSAFTYQGSLSDGGSPANGDYDIQFDLKDALTGGATVGTVTLNPVTVTDGVFSVELDYGFSPAFIGFDRWLEISVRPAGSVDPYTVLSPRQPLNSAPYANFAGGVNASSLIGQVTSANLAANVPFEDAANTFSAVNTFSNALNEFHGDGSNLTNLDASALASGTVPTTALGNAWTLGGNTGTNPATDFIGTSDNTPLDLRVNSARALRLEYPTTGTTPNIVGGYSGNSVGTGNEGASIGGGGSSGSPNAISGSSNYATIGGGQGNSIVTSAARSVIAGGANNTIGPNGNWAAIGGGRDNDIGPNGDQSVIGGGALHSIQGTWAVIGGGLDNTIGVFSDQNVIGGGKENVIDGSSTWSAIGGGLRNTITSDADFAAIPGGIDNTVSESYGFAAGRRAKSNHQGTFVWADATNADFTSSNTNQFLIRAAGGVGIGLNNPGSPLTVAGIIESTTGGVKFPDGSTQTTAAIGSSSEFLHIGIGSYVAADSSDQLHQNVSDGIWMSGGELYAAINLPAGARILSLTAHVRDDAGADLRFFIQTKNNGSSSGASLGTLAMDTTAISGYGSVTKATSTIISSIEQYHLRVIPINGAWPNNNTLAVQNYIIEWDRP